MSLGPEESRRDCGLLAFPYGVAEWEAPAVRPAGISPQEAPAIRLWSEDEEEKKMEHPEIKNDEGVLCDRCKAVLTPGKVRVTYLGSTFPTDLLKCPKCGAYYVPESLAAGKILEVEKTLEDK